MTGYKSKKVAAQDKLLDDDDSLTIAYLSGLYDGKKAAQPAQEPVAWKETDEVECPVCKDKGFPWPKCGHITYLESTPPQPAQEPIKQVLDAEFNRGYKEGVRDAYAKSPQRPWVGLTDKEKKEIYRLSVYVESAISLTEAKLKEKNT